MQSSRSVPRAIALTVLALSLALSGCVTTPTASGGGGSSGSSTLTNCAVGGLIGAGISVLAQKFGDPKKKFSGRQVAAVAAAGCVVGIAATLVGEQLNRSQQEKQERAFQAAATRQASARPGAAPPAPLPSPAPAGMPPAATTSPQTIGAAQWSEPGGNGGAAPTGPAVATTDGNQCVPMKEWANVNGRYVEQEVQACRPVADASGSFQRVVPKG